MVRIGEERNVVAIDNLNVTACWDGFSKPRRENSSTYTSPAGWVIVGHQIDIISSNNGWRSVSVINQGTKVASLEEVKSAYQKAYDSAMNLQKKAAAASIKTEEASELRAYSKIENPGNSAIRATVGAEPRGTAFIDKCRGWEEIRVRVTERYVGTKETIFDNLKSKHGLNG